MLIRHLLQLSRAPETKTGFATSFLLSTLVRACGSSAWNLTRRLRSWKISAEMRTWRRCTSTRRAYAHARRDGPVDESRDRTREASRACGCGTRSRRSEPRHRESRPRARGALAAASQDRRGSGRVDALRVAARTCRSSRSFRTLTDHVLLLTLVRACGSWAWTSRAPTEVAEDLGRNAHVASLSRSCRKDEGPQRRPELGRLND